jgi:hypothetical protein
MNSVFILMLVWVIQFDIKSPLVKISSHNTQCELLQMNMQKIFSIRFFYVCVQWCCLLQKKWNYVSLEPWIRTISNKMRAWIYIFSVFFCYPSVFCLFVSTLYISLSFTYYSVFWCKLVYGWHINFEILCIFST